jgi:hypothetical protein
VAITLQAQTLTINAIGGILDSRNPTGVIANRPPVAVAIPTQTFAPGVSFSIAPYVSDPDGDALTFERLGGTAPAGVTIGPNGLVTVPTDTPPGTYTVEWDANDGRGGTVQ